MTATLDELGTEQRRQKGPAPVELRTSRDYTLVTQALAHRADELKKLSEKTQKEGYFQESRAIRADASAIEDYILPRFKEQQELPLATSEEVRAGVAEQIRGLVHGILVRHRQDKKGEGDIFREQELLGAIALRVEQYGTACVEAGYAAGLAARESTPEALAKRSLVALSGLGIAE